MAAKQRYLPNAFWENKEKTQLKCIRMTDIGEGREKKDILSVPKVLPDGSQNQEFVVIVNIIGEKVIDAYTLERNEKKKAEAANRNIKREQEIKSKELERLFQLKLRAFEIPAIKNTENKELRRKLRQAKNEVEMNAYAAIILSYELGLYNLTVNLGDMSDNKFVDMHPEMKLVDEITPDVSIEPTK